MLSIMRTVLAYTLYLILNHLQRETIIALNIDSRKQYCQRSLEILQILKIMKLHLRGYYKQSMNTLFQSKPLYKKDTYYFT